MAKIKPINKMTRDELETYTRDLRERHNAKVQRINELKGELSEAEATMASLVTSNATLADEMDALQAKYDALKAFSQQASENATKLQGLVESDLSEEASTLSGMFTMVLERLDTANSTLVAMLEVMSPEPEAGACQDYVPDDQDDDQSEDYPAEDGNSETEPTSEAAESESTSAGETLVEESELVDEDGDLAAVLEDVKLTIQEGLYENYESFILEPVKSGVVSKDYAARMLLAFIYPTRNQENVEFIEIIMALGEEKLAPIYEAMGI